MRDSKNTTGRRYTFSRKFPPTHRVGERNGHYAPWVRAMSFISLVGVALATWTLFPPSRAVAAEPTVARTTVVEDL